ncbi:MAG TPA: carbon-nitrogen hydrolase family protein [Verrucomicrobiae bacterium]
MAAWWPFRCAGRMNWLERLLVFVVIPVLIAAVEFPALSKAKHLPGPKLVGVQLEFPAENLLPRVLNQALAQNTNADIFVLSEYTLNEEAGGVPPALTNWCREHGKYLVVGGKEMTPDTNYYNTAFVIGTNGAVVFKQAKCMPIQFFRDGLPAIHQSVWESPWGKIGLCICYDLSYTRVTDELIRQGAQMLIVPTMDVEGWGRHQHELHYRVGPVRAAEYGVPIFRLASSGISQAINRYGRVIVTAPMPGQGAVMVADLSPHRGHLPLDRYVAPVCTGGTGAYIVWLLISLVRQNKTRPEACASGRV